MRGTVVGVMSPKEHNALLSVFCRSLISSVGISMISEMSEQHDRNIEQATDRF
jgi:hypothetical protein